MSIRVAAASRQGRTHTVNQDIAFAKLWLLKGHQIGVIAVADGMGWYSNGERAAATVVTKLRDWFD